MSQQTWMTCQPNSLVIFILLGKSLCYRAFMASVTNDRSAELLPAIRRQQQVGSSDTHPLLVPLANAVDAVARLEASAAVASPAVAEGLRARIAYREAAGWLAYAHTWIHPRDLALRDAGLTGSYAVAALAGRLETELPTMTLGGSTPEVVPSDQMVVTALRLARLWRRLAEHRTWRLLANAAAVRSTLESLGWSAPADDTAIDDWLVVMRHRDQEPALIRAGRGARHGSTGKATPSRLPWTDCSSPPLAGARLRPRHHPPLLVGAGAASSRVVPASGHRVAGEFPGLRHRRVARGSR